MNWYNNLMAGSGYSFGGDLNNSWNMSDYYNTGLLSSGGGGGSSAGFWGSLIGGMFGGGSGSSGSGIDWGNVALGTMGGMVTNAKDKKEAERIAKLSRENYAFQLAEQEKYRQIKNQEIADAVGNYAQFNEPQANPYDMLQNVQSPFPQRAQGGLLNYGF